MNYFRFDQKIDESVQRKKILLLLIMSVTIIALIGLGLCNYGSNKPRIDAYRLEESMERVFKHREHVIAEQIMPIMDELHCFQYLRSDGSLGYNREFDRTFEAVMGACNGMTYRQFMKATADPVKFINTYLQINDE